MLSFLMNTPVKLSRTIGIKYEKLWHTFGLESFLCFLIELTSLHAAKRAKFQQCNWEKGEADNCSQDVNVLLHINTKALLKDMKAI